MPKVFVPRETQAGETRVAATPETVKAFVKAGLEVVVEADAGRASHLLDPTYSEAGARITTAPALEWGQADLVLKVVGPTPEQAASLKPGAILVSFIAPHKNLALVKALAAQKISTLAMELVPRITRAQKMDALSSQASIAGYKAVLVGASRLGKYFPLLMTAAGTVQPAKVVIMGAGVAGLQAIATAKRLGAVIWVSDVRPAVKEQVESLGGKFIDLPMEESGEGQGGYAKEMSAEFLAKQQAIIAEHVASADVVITTAQIPGKPAPRLVTAATVEKMRPGSVIVDLAAEQGGNCELTEPGAEVVKHEVLIVGTTNWPATMPLDASMLYARNIQALVLHILKKAEGGPTLTIDVAEEVTRGTLLTHAGEVVHGPTAKALETA
ncbi:MAG: Re/Si-specific NAD(P)(+) transhydrogenase subunit alpha [Myxococcales bacterium]|nr:Re/Si-specific NAD(P)(+) transhydrogenase subunit alpha [Myxococcales bacterium]